MTPERDSNSSDSPSFIRGLDKHAWEITNSVLWFMMDSMWMLGLSQVAIILIAPTIATGVLVAAKEPKKDLLLIDIAMTFWMIMNASWLVSEVQALPQFLSLAQLAFGVGLLSLISGLLISEDRKAALSRFRRIKALVRK